MHGYRRIMNGKEPMVDQPVINGWRLSWNPDDERFYVSPFDNGSEARVFTEFRNAVYYAKTH